MERRDISGNYQFGNVDEQFQLHDLINDANFEQLIDLIRGETDDPIINFCPSYDNEHITSCLYDNQFGPVTGNLFDFNSVLPPPALPPQPPVLPEAAATTTSFSSALSALPAIDLGLMDVDGDEEEENDETGEESSETTTTTNTTPTKKKADRSKTLVSERRRRGRMKEKLYALRALVPNITKMDKASIVGDAVMYVQDLQMQAKKLRAEIAGLDSSMTTIKGDRHQQVLVENKKIAHPQNKNYPIACKYIMKVEMFLVEERGFYAKVESNRGPGVAISLYKALESLARFTVQSSNLATLDDKFALTFTMKVKETEPDMNLPNSKLWVTGALLNQGFEFLTPPSAVADAGFHSSGGQVDTAKN